MSAIREYLNSEKYQPEIYDDDGWKLLEAARAELPELTSKSDECDKWRAWKPDDETLAALQKQAMGRNGTYTDSLAASAIYIRALEARLREFGARPNEGDGD